MLIQGQKKCTKSWICFSSADLRAPSADLALRSADAEDVSMLSGSTDLWILVSESCVYRVDSFRSWLEN